jgi:hypothetical protein
VQLLNRRFTQVLGGALLLGGLLVAMGASAPVLAKKTRYNPRYRHHHQRVVHHHRSAIYKATPPVASLPTPTPAMAIQPSNTLIEPLAVASVASTAGGYLAICPVDNTINGPHFSTIIGQGKKLILAQQPVTSANCQVAPNVLPASVFANVAWIGLLKGSAPLSVPGVYVQGQGDRASSTFRLTELSWINPRIAMDNSPPVSIQAKTALDSITPYKGLSSPVIKTLGQTKVPLGVWVWNASDWITSPATLITRAKAFGLKNLYMEIPMTLDSFGKRNVTHPNALRVFTQTANTANIKVWYTVGDPEQLMPDVRKDLIARIEGLKRYNFSAPANAKITGVQLDVEPHMMPAYNLNKGLWNQRLIDTLKEAKTATGSTLSLDACVTFWLADQMFLPDGSKVLDAITPFVDKLTIMNYTTDPVAYADRMQPYLRWGEKHNKLVHGGLELAPLPNENAWRYWAVPAGVAGRIWLVSLPLQPVGPTDRTQWAAVVLKTAQSNPVGLALEPKGPNPMPILGSRLSFNRHKAYLYPMVQLALPSLLPSKAFDGIIFHHSRELTTF